MFSISHDHALFEKYALPNDEAYPMPTARTVVSVKRDGSPASYFEDDVWDFNDLFNTKNEKKSKYTLTFQVKMHNPKLLLEFKLRMYWLMWGGKETLLSMEGKVFRKMEQIKTIQVNSDLLLRVFANTSINAFSYISNDIVFSQIKESLRGGVKRLLSRDWVLSMYSRRLIPIFQRALGFTFPTKKARAQERLPRSMPLLVKGIILR